MLKFDELHGIVYNTNMEKIVIDTNVVIAALKSSRGASNLLLTKVGTEKFIPCVSVPLIFEYEEVMHRLCPHLEKKIIEDILDYLCDASEHIQINYLWRPYLKDACDDMLLEVAVNANARYILTYNKRDFIGVDKFNIQALTPKEFLEKIGVLS